eukprot:scaffold256815_cov13-Tisochrysis_lutea.AAC.1
MSWASRAWLWSCGAVAGDALPLVAPLEPSVLFLLVPSFNNFEVDPPLPEEEPVFPICAKAASLAQ